jgi:hypothetical protein
MKRIVSYTAILSGFFIVFTVILGCASAPPSTSLSKTRELTIPELDGKVYISGIQYAGRSIKLSQSEYVYVKGAGKRIAILSIQIQNTIRKKEYNLSHIVLLDGDTRIEPEGIRYFSGNSAVGAEWFGVDLGVSLKSPLGYPLTMKGKRRGPYTVNLIYAVDIDKTISQADLFGQVIEFNSDMVSWNVIDRFN